MLILAILCQNRKMFLDSLADFSTARLLFLAVATLGALPAAETRLPAQAYPTEASPPIARRAALAGPFEAQVLHVLDGDTFEARVRVWIGQDIQSLVRLRGIDAPELASRCAGEERRAIAARDHLALLLGTGVISLRDVAPDKYGGRIVASATVTDDASGAEDVATLMLASGHARAYRGARRGSWCEANKTDAAARSNRAADPDAAVPENALAAQSPASFPSLSAQR